MSRTLEVPVVAAETDSAALYAIARVAALFPGPDRVVVAVELSDGTTRRATLGWRVDATHPILGVAIDRTVLAHRRPPGPST